MKNNRFIIGVIGASREIDEMSNRTKITQLACEIGEEITRRQDILLSGGKPANNNPARVHSAAMDGAKKAGEVGKPARLISVLRQERKYEVDYKDDDPVCKHLVVYTDFKDERNFINGYVPDVIIAVLGGKGTLSEIAFAHLNHVPVVFIQTNEIDTQEALKRFIPILENGARGILDKTMNEFEFDLISISKVDALINDTPDRNIAGSAREAVEITIEIAKNSTRSNDLPDNNKLNDEREKYRLKLAELAY